MSINVPVINSAARTPPPASGCSAYYARQCFSGTLLMALGESRRSGSSAGAGAVPPCNGDLVELIHHPRLVTPGYNSIWQLAHYQGVNGRGF